MKHFDDIYLEQDAAALATLCLPASIEQALSAHWRGHLSAAHRFHRQAEGVMSSLPAPQREVLQADQVLVAVKIGMGLPPEPPTFASPIARAVHSYAHFTHNFWIDLSKAWQGIFGMARAAIAARRLDVLMTPIFLTGHMLAIANWRLIGAWATRRVFQYTVRRARLGKPLPPLGSNITLASYPYSLFVTDHLEELDQALSDVREIITQDPHYQSVFLVSQLYSYGYTGEVARSEVIADLFVRLHSHGRLLRYKPLASVMELLPLALRGYADLVRERFDAVMAAHDPGASEHMINSHIYRAGALINLALGRHDAALDAIRAAIDYRVKTRSFKAWARHDAKVESWAKAREPFNPRRHRLLGDAAPEALESLGSLMLRVVTLMPTAATASQDAFVQEIVGLLREHASWSDLIVLDDPAEIQPHWPTIKISTRYVAFRDLPRNRVGYVERMLSALAPALKMVEATVAKMQVLHEENQRSSALVAIARTTQTVAHDVRKPFSMMQILMRSLEESKSEAEMRSRLARGTPQLNDAVASVNGMLQDIMDIGMDTPVTLSEGSLKDLLLASIREATEMFPRARVSTTVDFKHTHTFRGDPAKLKRVVDNLVGNAFQAMQTSAAATLTVATSTDRDVPGFLRVTITNTGSRIAPEDLPHVFEAFYTRGKKGGTGLGLAISRRIVEAHGGRIECSSAAETGVTFTFTVPRGSGVDAIPETPVEPRRARQAGDDPSASSALRVAVVDDSVFIRESWQSTPDLTVTSFASPESFLAFSSTRPDAITSFDTIVLDYDLDAEMTGIELADQLRRRFAQDLPPVLLSSDMDVASKARRSFLARIPKGPMLAADMTKLLVANQVARSRNQSAPRPPSPAHEGH